MGDGPGGLDGLRFGEAADLYDRARPSYPADAVAWILGPGPRQRVLDLAAGTGKLSEVVVALGHEVVAVEPDDGMRARLAARLPQVEHHRGTAEAIPLPDGSVDAVVVGQAFHWFDPPKALPEIARVLRPGGVLGLLWNDRDDAEPWVAELTRVIGDGRPTMDDPGAQPVDDLRHFTPFSERRFAHATTIDAELLVALIASRSYALSLDGAARADLLRRVRELATTHPDLAGRATFALPYVTRSYRAVALAATARS